jgi:hypothetical protein
MRIDPNLAILLGTAVIGVAIVGSRSASAKPSTSEGNAPTGPWCNFTKDQSRSLAKSFAQTLSNRYGVSGLPTFLDAVGYWESRWNPCVSGDSGGVSKGLYQMRADTVFRTSNGLTDLRPQWPTLSKDGKLSVILAADYAMRGGTRMVQEGDTPYWLAIRRWWKYPGILRDHDESNSASPGVRDRFLKALAAVGASSSFAQQSFNPSNWPGAKQVMREYGYQHLVD